MSAPTPIAGPRLPAGVSYGFFLEAWERHTETVKAMIELYRPRAVCEIGGGANPILPLSSVAESGIEYTVLDISRTELEKAPAGYRKVAADICASPLAIKGGFDFMFSKMLAEHVANGRTFHENVFALLAPGGFAFHFFPTLYCPPFVLNRLVPESVSDAALRIFSPREPDRHGKFPALYSWCRGPTGSQVVRLQSIGYEIVSYRGFFGHDYYRRIPVLRSTSRAVASHLCRRPRPGLTSFSYLLLRKPAR
jgi:hypothetical protein